jgi:hypothetical protein
MLALIVTIVSLRFYQFIQWVNILYRDFILYFNYRNNDSINLSRGTLAGNNTARPVRY